MADFASIRADDRLRAQAPESPATGHSCAPARQHRYSRDGARVCR